MTRTLIADPDVTNTFETDSYVMKAIRDVATDRHRARAKMWRQRSALTAAQSAPRRSEPRDRSLREAAKASVQLELPLLPRDLREVIELRYFTDPPWTLEAIAKKQGVSKTTAHRRLHQAIDLLAEAVARGLE